MKASAALVLAIAAGFVGSVRADAAGGLTVMLSSPAWSELLATEGAIALNARGEIRTATKVFLHRPIDGLPLAILRVTSDKAGSGGVRVQWSQKCPEPKAHLFADDFGTRSSPQRSECLVVSDRYSTAQFLKVHAAVSRALKEHGLALGRMAVAVSSSVATRSGRIVDVLLILQGSASSAGQEGVAQQLIDSGRDWHHAVREAAFSMSGELVLPALPTNF